MTLSNSSQSSLTKRRNSTNTNENTVGVVVGRFHVAELHPGHKHLISHASSKNRHLLIVVGATRSLPSKRNPLPFEMRRMMIHKEFPNAMIVPLYDHPSNKEWDFALDELVEKLFPGASVTMYGSRDSFLTSYNGCHKKEEIKQISSASGTEYRSKTGKVLASKSFRHGVIHAITSRPPVPYPTVDVAIMRTQTREVLLAGKKEDGGKLRFIGGFFDPTLDKSFEGAARRETFEETGCLEVDEYRVLGSAVVDDWRYRDTDDRVITTFFRAKYIFGAPRASDDIDLLKWVPYEKVMENLVEAHKPLGEMLMKTLL